MIATQIAQKDARFYFASIPAEVLMPLLRFSSRFVGDEAGDIIPQAPRPGDDVAEFIARIERSDQSFQRGLSHAKIRAVRNYYETAVVQPPIPGTVLLYTSERLGFEAWTDGSGVGRLAEPRELVLIIDGQHRLAALQFYLRSHPTEAAALRVPCIIFDGQSRDFATEMFAIINSTPTRISRSHLIELYQRADWADPDRRLAAQVAALLYGEPDSPLRYRINRLGNRSRQDKWILQSELFGELQQWLRRENRLRPYVGKDHLSAEIRYGQVRDIMRAASQVWEGAWGHPEYACTSPITLRALIRLLPCLKPEKEPEHERAYNWSIRLAALSEVRETFNLEEFRTRYGRMTQSSAIADLHEKLAELVGLPIKSNRSRKKKLSP